MVNRNPVATNNIIISFSREKILRISKPENAIELKDFLKGNTSEEDLFVFSTKDSSLLSFDHQYAFSQSLGSGFQTQTKIELLDTDSIFLQKFVVGGLEALSKDGRVNTGRLQPSVYIMFGNGDDFRFWSSPFVAVLAGLDYEFTATGAKKITITFVANDSGYSDSTLGIKDGLDKLRITGDISAPIFAAEVKLPVRTVGDNKPFTWKYVMSSMHTFIVGIITRYLRTVLKSDNVIVVLPDLDILLFEKGNNDFKNFNNYLSRNLTSIQDSIAVILHRLERKRIKNEEEFEELAKQQNDFGVGGYFNSLWRNISTRAGNLFEFEPGIDEQGKSMSIFKEVEASTFENAVFVKTLFKIFSDLGFIVSKDTVKHTSAHGALSFEFLSDKSISYSPVDGVIGGEVGGSGKFGMVYNVRVPTPDNTSDILNPIINILNRIKGVTSEKILNPIAFWENNIEFINFIAGKFKDTINIDPSKPLLIIGDRDMILNIVYGQASTAESFNQSIGNLLPQKKDVFFNVFNNESYLEEVFGFTGGKGKKGYFDRLDSANLPDDYTFDEVDIDNLKKFNIPIFKGGTINSNILEVNINSQKALLTSLLSAYTEILKNTDSLIPINSPSIDPPLARDQVKEALKNLLTRYKNFSPLATKVRLSAKNQAPDIDLLSEKLADNFVNAQFTKGLVKSNNKYKESTVAVYLAFIIDILRVRYTGSIKTIPMFGVSDSYLINWPSLMFLIDPNFIGANERTFLDTLYSGVWNIVGYRHFISSSESFSQFLLVKDLMNMPHISNVIEGVISEAESSFEKLTSLDIKENNEDEMNLESPLEDPDNIDIGSVDIDFAGGSRGVIDGEGEENIIFGESESILDTEVPEEIFVPQIFQPASKEISEDNTLTTINSSVFLDPIEAQEILNANSIIKNAMSKFGTTIDDINVFNNMLIFITNQAIQEGVSPLEAREQAEKEVEVFAEFMLLNGVEKAVEIFGLNSLSEQ